MFIYHDDPLSIVFSDASSSIDPADVRSRCYSASNLCIISPFNFFSQSLSLSALVFLHQVHSSHGIIFSDEKKGQEHDSFVVKGDYLITSCRSIGIGVVTADCLPLVLYDRKNKVVAAVHVGWKGAFKEIALVALAAMKKNFHSQAENIQAFFGPAARGCCYQVSSSFLKNLASFPYGHKALEERNNQYFFDLSLFVECQLKNWGILPSMIHNQHNVCTICNFNFCSHRRQGINNARRNITLVVLRA